MPSKLGSIRIRLLGSFELVAGHARLTDATMARRRAAAWLIKLLALAPNHSLHRDQVLEALWPRLTATKARNGLYQARNLIRTLLREQGFHDELVALNGPLVELVGGVVVDVDEFRNAATTALDGDPSMCERALELYRGELLPAELYEPWTEEPRERLRALRSRLLRKLVDLCGKNGQWQRAADILRAVPAGEYDEEMTRARMRVYQRAGDRPLAIAEYERLRDVLRRDLQAEPDPQSQALYRALASPGAAARAWPTTTAETPLVGRARELAMLRKALADAASGSGGIAHVSGEPGIGKTRLVQELLDEASLGDWQAGLGRSIHEEGVIPFRPWVEALQPLLATLSREELNTAAGQAAGELAELFPEPPFEPPASPVPRPVVGERTRSHLFDGISRCIRALAARSPLLLVLEDLHDADASTLSLLASIARDVELQPVLLVATVRNTDEAGRLRVAGALVRSNRMVALELHRLGAADIAEFARNLTDDGLTPGAVDAIVRESGGNPLFAREFARFIAGAGADADLAAMRIPASVQGIVASRLEALPEDSADALAVASVIGNRFEPQLLGRVAEMSTERAIDALNEASLARIVRPVDEQLRWFEFTHDLIRKALYTGLAYLRRAELHRAVAEAVESVAPDGDRVEELAYHFEAAIAGGGDVEKAVGYAIRAGELARAKCAWDEAVGQWERALRMMEGVRTDPGQMADLLERLADLLFRMGGDYQQALDYLERALQLRERLGDDEKTANTHSHLGRALSTHIGEAKYARYMDIPRALRHFHAAEPALSDGQASADLGYLYAGLASAAFNAVRVDDGLEASARAIAIGEHVGSGPLSSSARLLRGVLLKLKGRLAESRKLLTRAYAAADEDNDILVAYYTVTNVADWTEGYVAGSGHLYRRELEKPRFAAEGTQRTGLLQDLGCALCRCGRIQEAKSIGAPPDGFLSGMIHFCEGDWPAAERIWTDGFDLLAAVGHRSAYANQCHLLAGLHLARGNAREAERLLRDELAIGVEGGSALLELRARVELSRICVESDRAAEAAEHARAARAIVDFGEDWGSRAARLMIAEALIAAAGSDTAGAESSFADALAWLRSAQLPWDEAELHCLRARSLARLGRAADARSAARAAEDVYRRVPAGAPWLIRARASATPYVGQDLTG
jgi:DNA-binding SARP family transcriptional activator